MCRVEFSKIGKHDVTFIREMRVQYTQTSQEGIKCTKAKKLLRAFCPNIYYAQRPFGSSMLQVYIDGAKRMECVLKYPVTEPISYCTVSNFRLIL